MIEPGRYPTPEEIEILMLRARRMRSRAMAAMLLHAVRRSRRAYVVLKRRFTVALQHIADSELRYIS
jgi:hypothetical protein